MLLSLPAEAQLQLELRHCCSGELTGLELSPGVVLLQGLGVFLGCEPLAAACDPQFLVTTGYLWTMQCSRLGG